MQSLFELKTELPWDRDTWDRMNLRATELLHDAKKQKYTQAIVLLTSEGSEYGAVIHDALEKDSLEEKALFDRLHHQNDTEIRYALCMWEDGGIDLPSISQRKMLCELNPQNTETKIFVMTKNGISVIPLRVTLG